MGTFLYELTLIAGDGRQTTVDALVDTGSTFTTIPGHVLDRLGVRPFARIRAKLANGQLEETDVGEVRVQIDDYPPRTVICAFSGPDAPPILGAHTLEAFLLGVDPLAKRLVPVDALWAALDA